MVGDVPSRGKGEVTVQPGKMNIRATGGSENRNLPIMPLGCEICSLNIFNAFNAGASSTCSYLS